MLKDHTYKVTITWTGNNGRGTASYHAYERSHTIQVTNKETIQASSDPAFKGDYTKHNPEELLLASVSSCHMLWFLHLCSVAGIVVLDYTDTATGTMTELENGSGKFTGITLHPRVTIRDAAQLSLLQNLHAEANRFCFIANSLNFTVHHQAEGKVVSSF
ncbi:MAG: OsmC family protein [Sphingobacteriales bacterium]|nr:OsmC family protein [Sphingobacteriales bacterium]